MRRSAAAPRRCAAHRGWARILGPWAVLAAALTAPFLLVAPMGTPAAAGTSTGASFTDHDVQFRADGMTVYATYRGPAHPSRPLPAVLLIAGSGPTDRNGNSPEIPGKVDTLQALADWLSEDGVASLRYDKLGSGHTGLGPYALDPAAIGIGVFEAEAAGALNYLAHRPGVDRSRLGVIGHSEGALYALLLADGKAGPVPRVRALGLLEPLSLRYLSVISEQVEAQVAQQQASGAITPSVAAQVRAQLDAGVTSLRTRGTVAPDLPYGLGDILSPDNAKYLSEADRYDPAQLAAALPAHTAVLVTCSDADIQVHCSDVAHLLAGLRRGPAAVDFVMLHGVDHVLKVDASDTAANYGKDLPFSPQLQGALARFVSTLLR